MMTPGLLDRVIAIAAAAKGITVEEFHQERQADYHRLDERLTKQLASQRMTPEVLNKRCTL